MLQSDVVKNAFAMPLTSPAYPRGPYRYYGREYLVITYRTDLEKLRAVTPEPLQLDPANPIVKYEFMKMPDSTGFGDYTESGQVIPVTFNGQKGSYSHCMFLDDEGPIAGGRELWGFPKKLAYPKLKIETDTVLGTLDYGSVRVATATMGYKHETMDMAPLKDAMAAPGYLLKIIPHVDGTPRICELVDYRLEDINLQWAYKGPAGLTLAWHALAPVAELPVLEVISSAHYKADFVLGLGKVVHDYLA